MHTTLHTVLEIIVVLIVILGGPCWLYRRTLNDFRAKYLFITASEADAAVRLATEIGENVANALLAEKMAKAEAEQKRAADLFLSLQRINLDVNGRSQQMEITLLLNRKTLRLLDVEDASRLLAARTEVIYRDALNKRLGQPQQTTEGVK